MNKVASREGNEADRPDSVTILLRDLLRLRHLMHGVLNGDADVEREARLELYGAPLTESGATEQTNSRDTNG